MSNKTIRQAWRPGLFAVALVCAACSQESADVPTDAGTTSGVPPATTEPLWDGDALTAQVAVATADLVTRSAVAASAIAVNQARTVNWGSSAVGCPEEGKKYTESVVPGILLLLDAGGKTYRYHGRTGRDVFYCPDDRAVAPAFGPGQEFM